MSTALPLPTTPWPLVRTVHIDRIHVNGPLDHYPLGELLYKELDSNTVIPIGASAVKPNTRRNPEEIYIRSKSVQPSGRAYMLEFDACPPKILQGHNFFGHADLADYTYALFDRQTRSVIKQEVSSDDRQCWASGQVGVTCVHLCANFWCPEGVQQECIDAIDENHRQGKHRDEETCISIGFTPRGRSQYHVGTVYAKHVLLEKEWPRPGPLQTRILGASRRSLRVEFKLYSQWLKRNKLDYVMRWKDVDVNAIFFKLLAEYQIASAIQPLLTEDEQRALSPAERRAYLLWLNGIDLEQYYSRTTVWKYATDIKEKTQMNVRGQRRPDALPPVDLRELLVPGNIVPIPNWAYENPRRYWAPGRAMAEVAAVKSAETAQSPTAPTMILHDSLDAIMNDPELNKLAY